MERFRLAVDGDAKVVTMKHGGQSNRKIRRIMDLAGVEPWADAFQTLRSSREQIWCDEFSQSVVSKWIGHSITVSGKHYANRALDHHFDAASKRSSKAAQNVPAAPCTGLHRKNDDDRRGRGTAAGANTCNAMRVGASAPNNGAGGSRTPVPSETTIECAKRCEPDLRKVAQNPAHCQRDEALRYLVERWTELPVDTQAAILAIVMASTKSLNEMHQPPAP